jgi:DNA-binding beta-propeller fold protein YncE
MPSDVHPANPGAMNKSDLNSLNNSLLLQQANSNNEEIDVNTSYIDTVNHHLFVVDPDNNRIFIFDLNLDNVLIDSNPDNVLGQPDFTSSNPGTTQSALNNPNGIVYDPVKQLLFVADTNNNRIMVFDVSSIANGQKAVNVLGQPDFTSSNPGTTQSALNNPFSLDYNYVTGLLFVSDVNNNRLVIFNTKSITNGQKAVNVLGQPDFNTSKSGKNKSKLNNPNAIAYESGTDKLFVADMNNNRIAVFDVSSIANGQDSAQVLSFSDKSAMSDKVYARMESKPQVKPVLYAKGKFMFLIIFVIAIIAGFVLYILKKKK